VATENISICKLGLTSALDDQATRQAIETIANANYANSPVLLAQEYEKNNEIYLYRECDVVLGFFMVGWSRISCISGITVFLGLSCVDVSLKGRGTGKRLYHAFFTDAKKRRQTADEQIVWWAHTATPAAANGVWRVTGNVSPRPDGSYDEEHLRHLNCIEAHYGMARYRCQTHPFVLRGYAKARYDIAEIARIKEYQSRQDEQHLLVRLKVEESNGDRLMLIGEITPSDC
jgi:hypothetical protein